MKKLFSFSALCALFYAAPACANFFFSEALTITRLTAPYEIIARFWWPILLILIIQAFFLKQALPGISYMRAVLAVCTGNIPSAVLGATIPNCWDKMMSLATLPNMYVNAGIGFSFIAISNALLMLITIAILFRYPVKKLILPVFLGNLVAYFVVVPAWMLFQALYNPSSFGH